MKTYRWNYKCRNCGETFRCSLGTGNKDLAENQFFSVLWGFSTHEALKLNSMEVHRCNDVTMGVGDIISMVEVEG